MKRAPSFAGGKGPEVTFGYRMLIIHAANTARLAPGCAMGSTSAGMRFVLTLSLCAAGGGRCGALHELRRGR